MVPGSVIYTVCGFDSNQGLESTGKAILFGGLMCVITRYIASLLVFLIGRYVLCFDKKKLRSKMWTIQAVDFEAENNMTYMNAVVGIVPLLPLQVLNSIIGMN